ncbi:sulfite exporter TauE/SafE family protein [Polynucleobacter sp. MWH-Braz-FAM2G]|uniref:sulfite exporter TauE/SafE family protein n=1 Tax=Polynucleobacter sp. MWH-Braz-FAM2G TaxID=1855883 RepID=UPI001BFD4AEE|nr:sulfite exporter TauE/SafE family protein [Polynucleobacter sp. MWH-Braz-FAM2G]QWD90741.1 sulfite exporter TauE/SafE family protein [Polynucleobacter sp. MWH-Braz-FAM2G]
MSEVILQALILGALGLTAGVVGGVIGFGTTIILMPALVYFYGPIQAIPVIALVAAVANFSRIFLWWSVIRWRVCFVYGSAAIPFTVLGVNTLVRLDERLIEIALGFFLILLIPIRRWMRERGFYLQLWQMGLVGAAIGYLTGIVATTGAINTPFFLAFGLTKGAFLGTEAASTLSILLTKGITFHYLGFLNTLAIIQGLLIGTSVLVGSIFSKKIVLALPEKNFLLLMELVMMISGLSILAMAF